MAPAPEPTRNPVAGVWLRAFELGAARASVLGARAALFFALGLSLPAAAFGQVGVLFSLGAAANVLLDMGSALWLTRQGALERARTLPALGGLALLRLALAVPVLGLYLGAARALLGPGLPWGLAVAMGLFHLFLQISQTLYAFLRGTGQTRIEGASSLTLHGVEVLVLAFWYAATPRSTETLFTALAGLRGVAVVLLTALVLRGHGARLDVRAALRLVRGSLRGLGAFALLAVAQFSIQQADVLLLSLWAPADETGHYWACYRLVQNLLLPGDLLLLASLPRLARADSPRSLNAAYRSVHWLGGAWTLCVVVLVVVEPQWVLLLLGGDFAPAASLLAVLGAGVGLLNLPPYGLGLAMTEPPSTLLRAYGVAAVFNLALNLALVPRHGAWGAASATLATHLLLKVLFSRVFRARSIDPWALRPLAVAALPLAAWAGLALWLRPPLALGLGLLGLAAALALAPGLRHLAQENA